MAIQGHQNMEFLGTTRPKNVVDNFTRFDVVIRCNRRKTEVQFKRPQLRNNALL